MARHAVGQDTPYSAATPAVERSQPARPIAARHRVVTRARAGTSSVVSVNDRRPHHSSVQRNARLTTSNRQRRPWAAASTTIEVR